jgi:hypothetical protein
VLTTCESRCCSSTGAPITRACFRTYEHCSTPAAPRTPRSRSCASRTQTQRRPSGFSARQLSGSTAAT